MKVYSHKEIASSDGKAGKGTLVVVAGKVYDVSASRRWIGGSHMKRHRAGADLTVELRAAPHGKEVLERVEMVGSYEPEPSEPYEGLRGTIEAWLDRHPFFRRHPHPAIIHFPVALLFVAPLLLAIALLFHSRSTEWAAFCCLVIGVASIPLAMITGYFTWWINYEAVDSVIIRTKRRLAWSSLGVGFVALSIRLFVPVDALNLRDGWAIVYLVMVVVLAAAVTYTSFLGGKLTFPYKED